MEEEANQQVSETEAPEIELTTESVVEKATRPKAVSGHDPVAKFVKLLSWGRVSQLGNAKGSHAAAVLWVDTVMPWFRVYYEHVYSVPLTNLRLLNLIATYSARYSAWPDCDRVRAYAFKDVLVTFLDRAAIDLEDIRAAIGLAAHSDAPEIKGTLQTGISGPEIADLPAIEQPSFECSESNAPEEGSDKFASELAELNY